jgi:F-type H+-transporting ATPase subunit delta
MKISKEARRTSRQLLRACYVAGRLDDARVRSVVDKVAAAKPRDYLAVLESFRSQLATDIENSRAVVECATELESAQRYQLEKGLAKKYGREITLEFKLRPELLGGIRVKIGSDVWDGSVKARLEALQASLA